MISKSKIDKDVVEDIINKPNKNFGKIVHFANTWKSTRISVNVH